MSSISVPVCRLRLVILRMIALVRSVVNPPGMALALGLGLTHSGEPIQIVVGSDEDRSPLATNKSFVAIGSAVLPVALCADVLSRLVAIGHDRIAPIGRNLSPSSIPLPSQRHTYSIA